MCEVSQLVSWSPTYQLTHLPADAPTLPADAPTLLYQLTRLPNYLQALFFLFYFFNGLTGALFYPNPYPITLWLILALTLALALLLTRAPTHPPPPLSPKPHPTPEQAHWPRRLC
jgi:hypothetical protein